MSGRADNQHGQSSSAEVEQAQIRAAFSNGRSGHIAFTGPEVTGVHQGEIYNGNLSGKVHAEQTGFRSVMPVGGNEIEYSFAGSVVGNSTSGTVELCEYGHAQWSATSKTS